MTLDKTQLQVFSSLVYWSQCYCILCDDTSTQVAAEILTINNTASLVSISQLGETVKKIVLIDA